MPVAQATQKAEVGGDQEFEYSLDNIVRPLKKKKKKKPDLFNFQKKPVNTKPTNNHASSLID